MAVAAESELRLGVSSSLPGCSTRERARARRRAQPRAGPPHVPRGLRDARLGLPQAARRRARRSCSSPPSRASASGRWSFIGYRPRDVLRWSLADGGDPYALADRRGRAPPPGAAAGPAAVRRRRGRVLRLRLRAHGRAPRRAQPRPGRAAGPGADAHRRARRLRPPQAHGHDPRQRLRGGGGRRRRPRARPRVDRRGARAARRPAAARPRHRRRGAAVRAQHAARGVRGDGRADRRVRARGRRVPGRAVAALVGAVAVDAVLDLPRAARDQPVAVHVLPRLRGLPDRRRLARAARDRHGRPRLHAADRRHAPARRRRRRGPRRSPRTCSPTRRSAPST